METKICKNCGIERRIQKFPTNKNCVGGRRSKCIYCISPQRFISSDKYSKPHDYVCRRSDPDYDHERNCRKHGITIEIYKEILARQGGGCAICRAPQNGRRLSIDHDHACCPGIYGCEKCVRGILCASCNHGLGRFEDQPERLEKAADYLRHGNKAVLGVLPTASHLQI